MCQNKAVLERALDPGHDKVFVHNSKGVINMIEYKGYRAYYNEFHQDVSIYTISDDQVITRYYPSALLKTMTDDALTIEPISKQQFEIEALALYIVGIGHQHD